MWGSEELRLTPDFLASVTGAIYFDEKVLGEEQVCGYRSRVGVVPPMRHPIRVSSSS